MKPPKEFLTDAFIYKEYQGTNDWSEPIYGEEVKIKNCRIDIGSEFIYSTGGKQILYNGLIFCYEGLTDPMLEFTEESIVIVNGLSHTITKVIPVMEPLENKLYAYELEVV